MKTAVLLRLESGDQGTFGLLESGGFSVFLTELPWRDNITQISRIPSGVYTCSWKKSLRFGWCYEVKNVQGRGNILIHAGNYAGDKDKGYKTNSYGCLLPSLKQGILGGQKAGLLSIPARDKLYSYFNKEDFRLEIVNAYGDPSTP